MIKLLKRLIKIDFSSMFSKDKIKLFYLEKKKLLLTEFKDIRKKLKDLKGTNYKLGLAHFAKGNITDAILRFRIVLHFDKKNELAYYHLFRALRVDNDVDAAKKVAERFSREFPKSVFANYCNDILDHKFKKIPAEIIKENNNIIAKEYDNFFANKEQYYLYDKFYKILQSHPLKVSNKALDLGCGTGILGELLVKKDLVNNIHGVDVSDEMCKIAKNKKITGDNVYEEVHNKEITNFLEKDNKVYNYIFMLSILDYNFNVDEMFDLVNKRINKNSIFAFSYIASDEDFKWEDNKFSYSNNYIEDKLHKANFKVLESVSRIVYPSESKSKSKSVHFILAKKQ